MRLSCALDMPGINLLLERLALCQQRPVARREGGKQRGKAFSEGLRIVF
jgi:hypothetical protein